MEGEKSMMAPEGRFNTMKLDLPRFDGTDPHGWIFRIQEYFDYHGMPTEQR